MMAARVNAERLVLLAWSRAILLQLAHPLVAAGVAEHSTFRDGTLTAVLRLHQTVRAMLSLTFGTEAARGATLERILGIHRRVHGTLRQDVGVFRAGTPYSAGDPALVGWVHATLLESVPLVYGLLVEPQSDADRDAYCLDAAPVARALGAGEDVPCSWREVRTYMDDMYGSGRIAVSDDARALAAAVLAPPLGWLSAPAARVNRLFTVGLMPDGLRAQYRLQWGARDERALGRWVQVLRTARRASPPALALWADARRAPTARAPRRDAPRSPPPTWQSPPTPGSSRAR